MSRKEIHVSIRMRPKGQIYICRDSSGDIIIYEDQMNSIMNMIGKCRTRSEALEKIRTFGNGVDLHHLDTKNLTVKKSIRNRKLGKSTPTSSFDGFTTELE